MLPIRYEPKSDESPVGMAAMLAAMPLEELAVSFEPFPPNSSSRRPLTCSMTVSFELPMSLPKLEGVLEGVDPGLTLSMRSSRFIRNEAVSLLFAALDWASATRAPSASPPCERISMPTGQRIKDQDSSMMVCLQARV